MARISLNELRGRASTVDRAKLDATTDADIEAQRLEDGEGAVEIPQTARSVEPPKALRVRLGMTQPEMAAALNVPIGTWRNWEQGRTNLEPAALSLLRIISVIPDLAIAALRPVERGQSVPAVTPVASSGIGKEVTLTRGHAFSGMYGRVSATHGAEHALLRGIFGEAAAWEEPAKEAG